MTLHDRFKVSAVCFVLTFPLQSSWHPLHVAEQALELREWISGCEVWTPLWIKLPLAAVMMLLPLLGLVLSVLPLAASLRRGHSPGVAPALRWVAGISAALGVGALVAMLIPNSVLYASSPFPWQRDSTFNVVQPVFVAAFFGPALLLPVPRRKLVAPMVATLIACACFFGIAAALQSGTAGGW